MIMVMILMTLKTNPGKVLFFPLGVVVGKINITVNGMYFLSVYETAAFWKMFFSN